MLMMAATVPQSPAEPAAVAPVPWARIDRFVGQLTHDVRNGLNAIELRLTLLGELSADPEVMAEVKALRATLGNVTRQLQSVKTLTGPVTPHILRYPAGDFCEDLRERFARTHPHAAARIDWRIAVAGACMSIDPELTLGALLEILGNALQFGSAREASITLVAEERAGGSVVMQVHEAQPTPPAVSPADWGRAPLHTTRSSAYGLGLFRVRRIIEAQGGTLEADYADGPGVLTTTITLPGAADEPSA
jgi:signal transduction histidine kinase